MGGVAFLTMHTRLFATCQHPIYNIPMNTYINDTFTALVGGMTADRSKFKGSTYARVNYTDQQLLDAYDGSALVSRVVDVPANDAFRMWREWQAEADQITALEGVEEQFDVKRKLLESRIDARLFGNGYLFISDGADPSKPLVPETSSGLKYVVQLDQYQISEGEYSYNPMDERYGKPLWYDIMSGDTSILRVHPSRIVHQVGRERRGSFSYSRYGQSVLPPMMDNLKAYDAVMANIADMTMEAKVDVMKIQGLMQKVTDPTELAAMQAKLQLAMMSKATNGAIILDMEDEDWQQKNMSFATLPDIVDRHEVAAAGASGIPRSRLFGVQTGGLGNAGESDRADYYDAIKSIQENEITPCMSVLDKMIIKTALGSIPDDVHYNWRSLYQMDDKEKQEIGGMITKRYIDAVNGGLLPVDVASPQLVNELTEAGVSPGLEAAYNDWFDGVDEGDLPDDDDGDMIDA